MGKKAKAEQGDNAGLTYEQAVEQLEDLVERIESGEIGLEESIAAYERGAGLIARCREILDRAELRIEELSAKDLASGEGAGGDRADE